MTELYRIIDQIDGRQIASTWDRNHAKMLTRVLQARGTDAAIPGITTETNESINPNKKRNHTMNRTMNLTTIIALLVVLLSAACMTLFAGASILGDHIATLFESLNGVGM